MRAYLSDCICSTGWVAMGLPTQFSQVAGEYLRGVNYSILYTFHQGAWVIVQPTDALVPGKGYFVYINSCAPVPPPPAPVEIPTSYESERYTNDAYGFSIRYPKIWTSMSATIYGTVFYAKETGKDMVYVAVRPAANFKDAAVIFLSDLITASGAAFSPGIDSETIVTLSDGTQANQILFSAAFGMVKAAITGVIRDGNAIMICGASDPINIELYKEMGRTLTLRTGSSVGDMAPDFTLACADGNQVTLSALWGKKVIINFWNLQCHYSMEEMPYFVSIREKYPESDVAMLIINSAAGGFSANRREAVVAQITSGGYTFTVPLDEAGSVARAYNVTSGIPVTFFVDSTGIIKSKQDGSFPSAAGIETRLNSF